jgi:hypothetical protein
METYSKFLIDLTNIIDNLLIDPRKIDRTIDNTLEQSIQTFVANYSNNKVKATFVDGKLTLSINNDL